MEVATATENSHELTFIERGSSEWDEMWAKLAAHPLNRGLEEPTVAENEYEVWQYMGTVTDRWTDMHRGVLCRFETSIHTFRHRRHPRTGQREYVSINALKGAA